MTGDDRADRAAAFAVARRLTREAVAAGLVVTQLVPMRCAAKGGRFGCHLIQLWQPDGRLWAEGSHETTESVRAHIAYWRRRAGTLRLRRRAALPIRAHGRPGPERRYRG